MLLHLYWTVLLIFSALFVVYFGVGNINDVSRDFRNRVNGTRPEGLKTIVGFSMLKRIEMDGREYFCGPKTAVNSSEVLEKSGEFIWTRVENMEVYVSSVNFDDRLEPYRYLRIIGVIKGSWDETIYCQIYYVDGSFQAVKSTVTPIWHRGWGTSDNNTYFNPTLISCRLPTSSKTPTTVSLSVSPCTKAKRRLKIPLISSKRGVNFTVCVKPLEFKDDVSERLVQWMEICRILGAQRFHLFLGDVTEKTRNVLKWYNSTYPDLVRLEHLKPVTRPGKQSAVWQRRRYEIVAYNSCFYKNLDSEFVVPLDIDEVIVPRVHDDWLKIVRSVPEWKNYASIIVRNVYFFGTRHRRRGASAFFFGRDLKSHVRTKPVDHGKSFISSKNALTVFNHYALQVLDPRAKSHYMVPIESAQLNHYKDDCDSVVLPECLVFTASPKVTDRTIFRYKKVFDRRYARTMNEMRKKYKSVSD